MNVGGFVKPINKIIGEDGQTEYISNEMESYLQEMMNKIYQSSGLTSSALTTTSSTFTNENLRQLTDKLKEIESKYPPKVIMYSELNKSKIEEIYNIKLLTKDEYHLNIRFKQMNIIDTDKIYIMDDVQPKYNMSGLEMENWNEEYNKEETPNEPTI